MNADDYGPPLDQPDEDRWRVERSGSLNGLGYGPGWVAINPQFVLGRWFPTWHAAINYVHGMAYRAGR